MSAIAWATVQDALYDAVKAALPSCAVVWANAASPAPMPAKPFATLNLSARDIEQGLAGRDESANTSTAGTVRYSHHRRHTLSINVYSNVTHGNNHAVALLAQLSRELRKESRVQALFAGGCKAWFDGRINDLTQMLETRGESRAQCDVVVATLDSSTEAIGYILTAPITGIKVDGVAI